MCVCVCEKEREWDKHTIHSKYLSAICFTIQGYISVIHPHQYLLISSILVTAAPCSLEWLCHRSFRYFPIESLLVIFRAASTHFCAHRHWVFSIWPSSPFLYSVFRLLTAVNTWAGSSALWHLVGWNLCEWPEMSRCKREELGCLFPSVISVFVVQYLWHSIGLVVPWHGIEPIFPALAGRFLSTVPSEKSRHL